MRILKPILFPRRPGSSQRREEKIGGTIAVLALFAAMAVLQLAPLSLRPWDSVHDPGDPLLNTWILSWVADQLARSPFRLFEANVFFPHHLTLAFSEHMFPLAVVAAPFEFLTKNPVLVHNIFLLLTFILNAAGMFALLRHLGRSRGAGIVGGLIFAFGSYKIMHVSHLQLLASMSIPPAFLFLHKFLDEKTWRHALLFAAFFALQALSCLYYGLFFAAVLVVVLPVFLLVGTRPVRPSHFLKLAASLGCGCGVVLWLSLPYLRVFREMGLGRALPAGAELQNYFAAVPPNLLWGRLLHGLGTHEKFLFPGLAALCLAAAALVRERRGSDLGPSPRAGRGAAKVAGIVAAVFGALCLIGLAAGLAGGASVGIGRIALSANRPEKPALYLFLLGGAFLLIKVAVRFKSGISAPTQSGALRGWALGYSVLTYWAVALSFGGAFTFMGRTTSLVSMPFSFFYRSIVGFTGIREPARFAVFSLFGIGVLAGLGFDRFMRSIKANALRKAAAAGLIIFAAVESLSVPIERAAVPVGNDVPPTYVWLRAQPRGSVVLELPFCEWLPGESLYMYFSTLHKQRLINGYSGFVPASTYVLRDVFREFPDRESLGLLNALRADFVVFHAGLLPEAWVPVLAAYIESASGGALRLVKRFEYGFSEPNVYRAFLGDDLVFSVKFENSAPVAGGRSDVEPLALVPPSEFRISVDRNPSTAAFVTDGCLATRWTSGRAKQTGESVQIEFGEPRDIGAVDLLGGASFYDFGRGFRIEVSDDGQTWREIPSRYSRAEFCLALFDDQVQAAQKIRLDGGPARFLKIVQVGEDEAFPWSVAELRIYERSRLRLPIS